MGPGDRSGDLTQPANLGTLGIRVLPEVGEAVVYVQRRGSLDTWTKLDHGAKKPGDTRDSEWNRNRSTGRARTQIRRYCVANALSRLVTLTQRCRRCDGGGLNRACVCSEGPDRSRSRSEAMQEARNMIRRMRRLLGRSEPVLFVVEFHKDGVWHLHMATRLVMPMSWWADLWGRGICHPGEDRGDVARVAAYVAKYVGKDVNQRGRNEHSYEVAQGFQPAVFQSSAETIEEALDAIDTVFGWADRVVPLHEVVEGWPAARVWMVYRERGPSP